ncbi:hypothetical protein MIMGU_mgv1a022287mg, partial [Erythranthe guttata]
MAEPTSVPNSPTTHPLTPSSAYTTPMMPSISPSQILSLKLSDDNYMLWKAQLLPFLRGHNLYGFVDGSFSAPEVFDEMSQPNPAYSVWHQNDQSVMSLLISSLSESVMAHVLEATTSREVWQILEDMFSANSQARVMQLFFQLTTLKKGAESVAIYYRRAKLLVDTLAMAGKLVPSSEFIVFLLAGLGSDFDSVVTSITTQAVPLSPAQVYSHLLTHESRINHQLKDLTSSGDLSANFSSRQPVFTPNRGRGISRG